MENSIGIVDGIYDIKHICVVPEDNTESIIYISGVTSNFFNHYVLWQEFEFMHQ